MKLKKIIFAVVTVTITSLISGCSAISNITGDKLLAKNTNENLVVQSNIDMDETNINSQTTGRVKEVKVSEGDKVEKGQVLVVLDSDSLEAQRSQIEAQMETINAQIKASTSARDAAQAQLEKAQNGARPEEIDQAKQGYDLAQQNFDRVSTLYEGGAVAKADYDNAQIQLQVAKDKYYVAVAGARPEDIKVAEAQVNQANAAIEAAQGQLKQAQASLQGLQVNVNNATIVAPTSGTVTQVNVENGENVTMGMPIVVVTDPSTSAIDCNVKETDLSKVSEGQEVTVTIPTYKDQTFNGKVTRVNKNADFATKRATNDNGEFDVLSYGVKVELTDADITDKLYEGMTAFVDFGK